MKSDRLKKLYEYLKEAPDDPFNLYAIANEFRESDPQKSREFYDQLLNRHPDYLPTYYHAAKLYETIAPKRAGEIYRKGIKLAERQQNHLTIRELKSAYQEFLFEE